MAICVEIQFMFTSAPLNVLSLALLSEFQATELLTFSIQIEQISGKHFIATNSKNYRIVKGIVTGQVDTSSYMLTSLSYSCIHTGFFNTLGFSNLLFSSSILQCYRNSLCNTLIKYFSSSMEKSIINYKF